MRKLPQSCAGAPPDVLEQIKQIPGGAADVNFLPVSLCILPPQRVKRKRTRVGATRKTNKHLPFVRCTQAKRHTHRHEHVERTQTVMRLTQLRQHTPDRHT